MTLCTYGGRFARTAKAGQVADPLEIDDWYQTFTTRHDFDAHAWPYVRYLGAEIAPPVRAAVSRGEPATEGSFLCNLIFLDYDESNEHAAILERLSELDADHWIGRWAAIYPTRGGMRIVYRLSEPVLPAEYGPIVRGVALELFRRTQLRVDPTTDQWHRCFRLPSVRRDDAKHSGPTWEEPYYFAPILTQDTIDPDVLPSVKERLPWGQSTTRPEAQLEQPDIDTEVGQMRERLYRKALNNSRFRDYIFEHLEIQPGRRDQMLLGIASETVGKCYYKVPECSAEEIFALLVPIALGFADTDKGESSTAKLWRMIQHCWNGEVKKERERKEKEDVDRSQREVLLERMLQNMPEALVPNDHQEREAFAMKHICLQTVGGVFAINEEGEYGTQMLKSTQLPAYFNGGLSFVDPMRFRTPTGRMLSGQEILNEFSTVISDAIYIPGVHASAKLKLQGDSKVLEVSPFSLRQDLVETAAFDHEVDEWLNSFHDAELLKRWLASALALDRGPTAALFLKGPARAGKSMLAMAIAECFGTRPASAAQAFSDFNGALAATPVVLVDEGLPHRRGGLDTADLFRSLVTGSGVSTQKKFMDQLSSTVPFRIIFAANSYDMVTELIGKRSLGTEDKEAFRERILCIEPGPGPSQYLDRKGSMAFTVDDPKGSWIGGRCRLARHIIRLYQIEFLENSFVREGKRMLVEGKAHPAFTLAFDLSGLGREVVEALGKGIEAVANNRPAPGTTKSLEVEHGVVWIRKWPFCTNNSATPAHFAKALERFCTSHTRRSPIDMTVSYKLDIEKVITCADSLGLPTRGMRELQRQAQGIA